MNCVTHRRIQQLIQTAPICYGKAVPIKNESDVHAAILVISKLNSIAHPLDDIAACTHWLKTIMGLDFSDEDSTELAASAAFCHITGTPTVYPHDWILLARESYMKRTLQDLHFITRNANIYNQTNSKGVTSDEQAAS